MSTKANIRIASDSSVVSTRLVRAWRRAKGSEILRAGDRLIYADGLLGGKILNDEIGLRVDESGYFGIARMRKRPNVKADLPPTGARER